MVLRLQRRQRFTHALSGVDAAAQERAFQRVLAVHATTAEAGGLAAGVEPLEHRAIRMQAASRKVGFDAAERLAGEDFRRTAISGPLESSRRRCGAAVRTILSPKNPRAMRM